MQPHQRSDLRSIAHGSSRSWLCRPRDSRQFVVPLLTRWRYHRSPHTQNVSLLTAVVGLYHLVYKNQLAIPLRKVSGPVSFAVTKWRLALADYQGVRTRKIHSLHQRYGKAVRIGPNEVSFSSLSALKKIYGSRSGFERTEFYRMFDVYGYQNLFTFAEVARHAQRKKILAHVYSNSAILSPNGSAKECTDWTHGEDRQFHGLDSHEEACDIYRQSEHTRSIR